MPKNVKRKTEATADDSAKKIREEKNDLKTDGDEIKGQNSIVKRQINFATCMKCIKGVYDHPKITLKKELYNNFESIIKHTVNFDRDARRRGASRPGWLEFEVGDKKGIPLFSMSTFDEFHFSGAKGLNFRDNTNFTCRIGSIVNDNESCPGWMYKFELLIEHQKNAHSVEYSAEFFEQDHEMEDQNSGNNIEVQISQSDTVYKNSESDAVNKSSESDEEDQNSESDNENKNDCFECVEKNNKIQTLQITEIKLKTNVTSAQKVLEESKAESKLELEKVRNQLQTEVASKKYLEESLTKYRKLRQGWAVKVFQSDPDKEDLDNLLSLEPEKLFKKYEQISGLEVKDDVVPVFTHTEDYGNTGCQVFKQGVQN